MRKVVFKGIINGQEFDNVKDYNEAMNKLLANGVTNISASSETKVVNETEPVKEVEDIENDSNYEFDPQEFLPFFNNESTGYYLDTLVSDDDKLNEKNLKYVEESLEDAFDDLKTLLEEEVISLTDAFGFINMLKDVRSNLETDSSANRTAVAELTEKISQDTQKLKLLNNARPVLATLSEYYDAAFDEVKDYLLKL